MKTRRNLGAAVSAVLLATSCIHAKEIERISLEDIPRLADELDGKLVSTSGFLIEQPLGGFYLYPDSRSARIEDYSDGLDVVAPSPSDRVRLREFSDGACVQLSGVFTHFSDSVIITGNFRSSTGRLEIKKVTDEECS